MQHIVMAREGRVDMLKAIFGSEEENPKAVQTPVSELTPEAFDAWFG